MSDMKRLLSGAYMLGYSDARNDKAIDPIGAIERLTMNLNKSELISRQDAIDVVRQYCIDNQIEDGDYHSNGIEYELNNLPSAQRKGKWIDRSEGGRIIYPWHESYECNQCGHEGCGAWEYCPRCGARMVSD